jgi:hypothetical protein
MGDLGPAKDIIRDLPRELQMSAVTEVNRELVRRYGVVRATRITGAVEQIFTASPDLTIEDGNQLQAWQEEREARWGGGLPPS